MRTADRDSWADGRGRQRNPVGVMVVGCLNEPCLRTMATFASPPPRRTRRYATPRPLSATPPPPRTRRLVGAHRPTPPRQPPEPSMDVDEAPALATYTQAERSSQKDLIFAKTEELIVGLHGTLPVEVKHALRSTGARRPASPFTSFIVHRFSGRVVYGMRRH